MVVQTAVWASNASMYTGPRPICIAPIEVTAVTSSLFLDMFVRLKLA